MSEGLSPQEVGKGIAEKAKHGRDHKDAERRDRLLSIAEAVLLSIVALLAAWSGYAAAKWSTESRVGLAKASAARTEASRANLRAINLRNFDSSTFEAWFSAYAVHNKQAMALAEHRFRPGFRVAFDAWRATKPETKHNAPRGPTYMPQYRQPGLQKADSLNNQADADFEAGANDGETSDKYIRTTVFLASVLFIVGISTHFPLRSVRYGLVGFGMRCWSSPSCTSRSCLGRPHGLVLRPRSFGLPAANRRRTTLMRPPTCHRLAFGVAWHAPVSPIRPRSCSRTPGFAPSPPAAGRRSRHGRVVQELDQQEQRR